ncbi:60S acidic ribosomal protein P2-like [Juglans microcarpa x Juglans regia]|uniref:60S acidic ribosomal protein P2-like n=1 Tax=Juglans microcarpa x Juglans regia TaxID=2249226 RepID=UPI001B7DDB93|nr:60S acidic ribosomal protein P2-like [Juglans microcarpa x Juglans regia]
MAKREEEMNEIRVKTTEEINEGVVDLKGELLMLRLQKFTHNEFKVQRVPSHTQKGYIVFLFVLGEKKLCLCLDWFNAVETLCVFGVLVLGGNIRPSAENLKDILGSVGAEVDDDKIELLLSEVKGKDITELIASGREKLASVPSGGGGAIAVAAIGGGGSAAAAPAAAEPKKEEKVEEKEESDDDLGFSLFD